jgi:predicted PurR-regulated permease PerM
MLFREYPMAKTGLIPDWQRAVIVLTATVVTVVVVAGLYWAQTVLIPFALGIFLSFLLSPLVRGLQRRGLGRVPSVLLVVTLAAGLLFGAGWVVTAQISGLLQELPQYTDNIKARVHSLRDMGQGTVASGLDRMVNEISAAFQGQTAPHETVPTPGTEPSPTVPLPQPPRVVLQQSPEWLSHVPGMVGGVLGPLATLGLAAVLAVFMLLKREDLRSRFIRLAGQGQMTVTTKGLDDAAGRISRYLIMQLVINATYGLIWGIGLTLIGIHHALLWGFLAAALRYVPYIGAPASAVLPLLLSLAQFEGWLQPLLVGGLLLTMELITGNVLEPLLYGKSIGVSEVALLVAAAVWAFLWGPIGLVLSGPLTVCLVVLGRHVPQLEFLGVILGDQPVLEPEVNLYQRLLARDQDEATQFVRDRLKEPNPEKVYDDLMVPLLTQVRRDRERDSIEERDEQFVLRATQEILEDLDEDPSNAAPETEPAPDSGSRPPARVLGLPSRDEADVLALNMLRQLLGPTRWEMEVASAEMLSSELVELAVAREPEVICVAALPPGGLIHTRYLCKRLRARFPKARILVGRWGLAGNLEQNQQELQEAGADLVATTLLETVRHLHSWLPVLESQPASPPPARALPVPSAR